MRWHGTTKTIAFFAHALPAALIAAGLPARSAKSEYEITFPGRTFFIAFQADCEKVAPG